MDLIWLIETSIAANALEQKRDEHCSILRRQLGEDLLELASVIRAEIRREPYSSDHDSSERASRSYFVDDGLKVCLSHPRGAARVIRRYRRARSLTRGLAAAGANRSAARHRRWYRR